MVIAILRDEEGHRRLFEGYLREYEVEGLGHRLAIMSVEAGSLTQLEPILDALPTPAAADRAGHGAGPLRQPRGRTASPAAGSRRPRARHYEPCTACSTRAGRPLAARSSRACAPRAASASRTCPVDWDTPAGRRSIVVSATRSRSARRRASALLTFEDVTELEAARRRSTLLAEAAPLLARSLDPERSPSAVAELTVPAYADWCFVELLQPDGRIARDVMAARGPGQAADHRGVRPALPARSRLAGRLAAGHPHAASRS